MVPERFKGLARDLQLTRHGGTQRDGQHVENEQEKRVEHDVHDFGGVESVEVSVVRVGGHHRRRQVRVDYVQTVITGGGPVAVFHRDKIAVEQQRTRHVAHDADEAQKGEPVGEQHGPGASRFQQPTAVATARRLEVEPGDLQATRHLCATADHRQHLVHLVKAVLRDREVHDGRGRVVRPTVPAVGAQHYRHETAVDGQRHHTDVIRVVTADFRRFGVQNLVQTHTLGKRHVEQ